MTVGSSRPLLALMLRMLEVVVVVVAQAAPPPAVRGESIHSGAALRVRPGRCYNRVGAQLR
jgi:hypothetical protein